MCVKGVLMSTLKDVIAYLKTDTPGAKGSPTPLVQVKELSAEDRAELVASLDSLPDSEWTNKA
jgi:hypothetical protein